MSPETSQDVASGLDRFDPAPLARALLGRSPDAEDVAQDVWLLLRRQASGRGHGLGWIRLAIVHMGRRRRQRDLRRAERERIVARPDRTPSVLELLEREALREQLAARVDDLGEPYREVIRLRFLEDRAIDDIAASVGRSPGTVRSQLTRGLERLRAGLGVEPERRARWFPALFPWPWPRAGEGSGRAIRERIGAVPVLAGGIATSVLVITILLLAPRSERGQRVASARPVEQGVAAGDPPGARTLQTRTPITEETVTRPPPEEEAWAMDVEGEVLDADGAPVPDAAVLVGSADGGERRIAARSDVRGRYRVEHVDGRQLIWAEAPERFPSHRHLLGSKAPERRLDLHLGRPIGALVGRVLSFDGMPVPRARVTLLASIDDEAAFDTSEQGTLVLGAPPARTRAAEDGSFRLGCPSKDRFLLLIEAEGHAPEVVQQQCVESRLEIGITLPAACVVEGRLLRPSGSAAVGARLGLALPAPLPARETTTDEAGRFRFGDLPPGSFALRLVEDPTGASASCFVEGTLEPGTEQWQEVTLAEAHTFRGRAFDGDRPAGGRVVVLEERLFQLSTLARTTVTAPDGSFLFRSCAVDRLCELQLLGSSGTDGLPAAALRVRADEGEIALRSEASSSPPGSLTGRFESGEPGLAPVLASLRRDSVSPPVLLRVDPATGSFSAPHLPPDGYNLRAWVPGVGIWKVGRVEIRSGQRTDIVERLPEPGILQVRVELPDTVSWDDVVVSLMTPAFAERQSRGGWRRLAGPERGQLRAPVFVGDYGLGVTVAGTTYESRRQVHIESGRTTHAAFSLPRTISMTLRLALGRELNAGESVSLLVDGPELRSRVDLHVPALRNSRSVELRVPVRRDTRELRVETSQGLRGMMSLRATELVPGGLLGMILEDPWAR